MTTDTLPATTAPVPATRRRRPRGQYPKKAQQPPEAVAKKLPEYLEAHEAQAIIRAADDPRARLLMM